MNLFYVRMIAAGAKKGTTTTFGLDAEFNLCFPDELEKPEHLPSIYIKYRNGDEFKTWMKNKVRHRDEGPATITIAKNEITCVWFKYGKMHRENKPAYCSPSTIGYYCDHYLHRFNAPAEYRLYEKNSKLTVISSYWIHGHKLKEISNEISVEQFHKIREETLRQYESF